MKKKPATPQSQATKSEDVIPPSLEKKKSGYRSFMQREGPKALGSKEIPEVSLTEHLRDALASHDSSYPGKQWGGWVGDFVQNVIIAGYKI